MRSGETRSLGPATRRRRRLASLAIVSFFGLQLSLAARGFGVDLYRERGHFSWNMYAHRYDCRGGYRAFAAGEAARAVDPRSFLTLPDRIGMVLRRDVLPSFHAYLCAELARSAGAPLRVEGEIVCALDHQPEQQLVSPGVDLCRAPSRAGP